MVSEVAMTDRADASVVGWTADESGRQVFSPEDEEVTVKVLFNFNYRGVYEWYKVEWIAPGGVAYQVVTRRTDFGSHRDLKASLKIRGKMASRMPGLWRVRVSLRGRDGDPDRELVSRLFRIDEPSAQMVAAGLTPVDAPKAERGRPLANYSRTATHDRNKTADERASASLPSAGSGDVKQPVADASPEPKAASTSSPAPSDVPSWTQARESGVLPPLAVIGAISAAPAGPDVTSVAPGEASGVPDETAKKPTSKPVVAPLPAAPEVAGVTLRSTPPEPGKRSIPPRAREYDGCPPLYYRPGPGCVEQAPEE